MKERTQRRQKEIAPAPAGSGSPSLVYIMGESPLVETVADLCLARGFRVIVRWNPGREPDPIPKTLRRSSTVPADAALALELTLLEPEVKQANIKQLGSSLPPTCAIVSSSVTVTAARQASWIAAPHRLIGIGLLPGLTSVERIEVAPTAHTPAETVEVVRRFFHSLGKEIEIVQDRVGLVLPRLLCQLINEALAGIQEDLASPADIDLAARKGMGLPVGLLEWGQRIGFGTVVQVLDAIAGDTGEEQYRPGPLLRKLESQFAPAAGP
jgi:3-hydroxybutyryl-CoA dehydrogenase